MRLACMRKNQGKERERVDSGKGYRGRGYVRMLVQLLVRSIEQLVA